MAKDTYVCQIALICRLRFCKAKDTCCPSRSSSLSSFSCVSPSHVNNSIQLFETILGKQRIFPILLPFFCSIFANTGTSSYASVRMQARRYRGKVTIQISFLFTFYDLKNRLVYHAKLYAILWVQFA